MNWRQVLATFLTLGIYRASPGQRAVHELRENLRESVEEQRERDSVEFRERCVRLMEEAEELKACNDATVRMDITKGPLAELIAASKNGRT